MRCDVQKCPILITISATDGNVRGMLVKNTSKTVQNVTRIQRATPTIRALFSPIMQRSWLF